MINMKATMHAIKAEVLIRSRFSAWTRNRGPRIVAYMVNVKFAIAYSELPEYLFNLHPRVRRIGMVAHVALRRSELNEICDPSRERYMVH
jgi:hypothetical protein